MSNQTFDQNLNTLIGVRDISDEAATSISGGSDRSMDRILRHLNGLNRRMAGQQLKKKK
jgi:hypothetical protein